MLQTSSGWSTTGFGTQQAGWLPATCLLMVNASPATGRQKTWRQWTANARTPGPSPQWGPERTAADSTPTILHETTPIYYELLIKMWNKSLSTGFLKASASFLSLHYITLCISICNFYKKKNSHLFLCCEYMHIYLILFSIGYWHNSSNGIAIKKIILT